MFGAIKRIGAAVKNAISGQGYGSDMAGSTGYYQRPELSPSEVEDLMRAAMIRNAIECVPDDIMRTWRTFKVQDEKAIFKIEKKYNVIETVFDAIVQSKMYGGCVILPQYVGTEDDLKKPKGFNERIVGFTILPQHLVHKSFNNDFLSINFAQGQKEVHKSRVYFLSGKKDYSFTTNFQNGGGLKLGQSEVDLIADSYVGMVGSDQQLSHLLARVIVDVRKQKNLMAEAERAARSPQISAQLSAKYQYLAEATNLASNHQGIICDKDEEDVVRLSVATGLGQLVSFAERKTDLFVAATGYPRTKVLGEQSKGMNNDGSLDTRRYYDKVDQYRNHKVYDFLNWIDELVFYSENMQIPEWEFGNLWQMSETEQIDYNIKVANRDKIYYDILTDAVVEPIIENLKKSNTYDFSSLNVKNG